MSAYSSLVTGHSACQAYYRMGESSGTTLTDSKGTQNGTIAGSGVTYGVTGALNGDANTALTFDATSNPATVADTAGLPMDLGDVLSVEFWVKRSATQGANQQIVNKGTGAYQVRFNSDDSISLLKDGSGIVKSNVAITDSTTWHHVVCTKNGSAAKVYVDGADVSQAQNAATLGNSANVLRIGHATGAGADRFPGSLDELALYNGELSAAEVLEHYKVGKGLIGQATETDTVTSLSKSKAKAVAQATETDLSQAIAKSKAKATGQASETDEANALAKSKSKTLAQSSESDEAQPIAAGELHPVAQATETDLALPLTASKQVALGQVSETDVARSIAAPKFVAVGQAQETDSALAITQPAVEQPGGGFSGLGRVILPKRRQAIAVMTAHETDEAVPLGAFKTPSRIQIEDDELLLLA